MKFQREEGLQVVSRLGLSKEENLLILCSKKILKKYFAHYFTFSECLEELWSLSEVGKSS